MYRDQGVDVLGMRRGERVLASLFFLYFVVLASAHYASKSVRQATYIDVLGADKLPWVYLIVACVSLPVLLVYSRITERMTHVPLVVLSCLLQALGLVAFYWMYGIGGAWVPVAFYVWMTLGFGIAVSQLWSLTHEFFDSRQARRLFGFIGAGGLLGGVPGGQLASWSAGHYGTHSTLLWAAALMVVAAGIVLVIATVRPRKVLAPSSGDQLRSIEAARGGLAMLRESRLLIAIAILMVMTVVVAQMVDLQFFWMLEEHTESLDQRTELIGKFFSLMGITAFFFQLLLTQRIHRWWGVDFGMRILPGSLALVALLYAVSLGFVPAVAYAMVWMLKLAETGFRHSVDQSTRELLFVPVAEATRRRAKAFIDVFVQRAAKGVAALFLLPVTFGLISMTHLGWAIVFWSTVWFGLTWLVRKEYMEAFREGLMTGVIQEPASINPRDLRTVTTLVQSLGSADPRETLQGIELLAANGHASLIPPLLLHHENAEVRYRTLEVLGASRRYDAAPLVEKAIGDDDPRVRSGAMQTLAALRGAKVADIMVPRLDDPDPGLRASAAAGLLAVADAEIAEKAHQVLADLAGAAEAPTRIMAAEALATADEPSGCALLVQLLYDDTTEVVRAAIEAVRKRMDRDGLSPIYLPILIALTGNRRLKHDAREALVSCGEAAIAALSVFMASPDEGIWVRRAVPKTIARIGTQQAVGSLVDALTGAGDGILRSKLIAALVYLRVRSPELQMPMATIRRQIHSENLRYHAILAELCGLANQRTLEFNGPLIAWPDDADGVSLLEQLLAERLAASLASLFGLLSLLYPPLDVQAAFRSFASGRAELRARAVEYLDNTLRGRVAGDVLSIIDECTPEERCERARQLAGGERWDRESTVRGSIFRDLNRDPSARSLSLAAAHLVYTEERRSLCGDLEQLARTSPDDWVAETAAWVVARMKADETAVGDAMQSAMAKIEMVVFLQKVDLFSSCTAEQVVQLASIATERRCQQGEVIYRCDDSASRLYSVVEGEVELQHDGERVETIGPYQLFGDVDILSGSSRCLDAVACSSNTRLLSIDAEDFFDLLSNNIEIVKSLFRQVTAR